MFKKVPHTYVIIFSIIIVSAVLTWIVPGGDFMRQTVTVNNVQKEIIVSDSFVYRDSNPQTWHVFSAIFDGFVDKADIIVFILIIGGAFWIVNETKAIDVGIISFLGIVQKFEHVGIVRKIGSGNIIITFIMLLFSLFGATFGMSEETIAFTIIFIPLALKMGYDSIVGVSLCFVGAGLGFAGAILNPFTIGIAQGLSDIPLFSGIEYRLFCWVVINTVGIGYVLWYANRIKKDPERSEMHKLDQQWMEKLEKGTEDQGYYTNNSSWFVFVLLALLGGYLWIKEPVTVISVGLTSFSIPAVPFIMLFFIITGVLSIRKSVHFFILIILSTTILVLIAGVMGYGWYIKEIATLFFFMGICAGIASGKAANSIANMFIAGVKDIMSAALVVGLAGGIIIILTNGGIIDTLLHHIAHSMRDFGKVASVGMMYVFQTIINIIIPSGSAKAALTMPIMAPFSDLIGVSRQATVMAFQFGDGFTNMITPTSPVLIGVLGIARIPYDKWLKWIVPFMGILIVLGFLLLIPTVLLDLNGF